LQPKDFSNNLKASIEREYRQMEQWKLLDAKEFKEDKEFKKK
jgi:hypothetical protein